MNIDSFLKVVKSVRIVVVQYGNSSDVATVLNHYFILFLVNNLFTCDIPFFTFTSFINTSNNFLCISNLSSTNDSSHRSASLEDVGPRI